MADLDNVNFLPSESEILEDLLKNPSKDYQKLISIIEKKIEEKVREFRESNYKYRNVIDDMGMGIVVLNKEGYYEIVNKRAAEILGGKPKNFIGKSLFDLFPKNIAEEYLKSNKEIIESGVGREYERTFDLHGDIKTFLIKEHAGTNLSGVGIYLNSSSIEITERKEVEQRLKESEKNYRTIINSARDGILIIGLDGKFKFISPQLSIMLGGREINLKTNIFEFIHPDDKDHLIKLFTKGIREKSALNEEIEFRSQHKDGYYIWLSSSIKNYYDDDGYMIGFISLLREVTDKKIAKQKLKESEEKYRLITENSNDLIAILDEKMQYTFVNRAYELLGYSTEEIYNSQATDFIHPNDIKRAVKAFRKGLVKGTGLEELRIKHKDGRLSWYEVKGKTFKNLKGKTNALLISRDITERKKIEDLLYHEQDLIRTLLENHPDFIYFKDKKARFQHISKRFCEFFERSMDDIIGKTDLELFPEDIAKQTYNEDLQVIKTGLSLINKEEKAAGTWFLTTKIPWYDKNGKIKGLFGISHDVTELKKAQEKLKELGIMKSEFLRRASHELKTPLISIKGFSDLILTLYREELNPDMLSKLGEINQGCERLQNIINDLIHTSRLESSELKPKFEKEDLTFLINYCVDELHAIAAKREHSINTELPNSLIARFEKEEIHDVITNLLSNAIKYTPPKGWIHIKTETLEDFIIVSIKDNGIGFTKEEKNRIFKQFGKIERYGQGLDLGIDGSGLGLYISKKIVESHGGKIWMESEGKHKGSTFYFSLPK